MLDLSEEYDQENIATCAKYFKRMAAVNLWLEMEIGITGGEEDGVDNTGVKAEELYTTSEQVWTLINGNTMVPFFFPFHSINDSTTSNKCIVLRTNFSSVFFLARVILRIKLKIWLLYHTIFTCTHLSYLLIIYLLIIPGVQSLRHTLKDRPDVFHCSGLRQRTRCLQGRQRCPLPATSWQPPKVH